MTSFSNSLNISICEISGLFTLANNKVTSKFQSLPRPLLTIIFTEIIGILN